MTARNSKANRKTIMAVSKDERRKRARKAALAKWSKTTRKERLAYSAMMNDAKKA